ncbi:hypothetical protein AYI68_g4520 [Smittium mucronatum]|uniref:CCAAT-binding factor domain-containing protein n=1 Tax=Smittium mucronatum TaxID=133383 RepID=A0A1R0GWV3_9FUNG|nr:hypothetical protein AYI68_g4520 [Smittium mucronatum]
MSKISTKRKREQGLTEQDEAQIKQIKDWELQISSDQKNFNNLALLVNLETSNNQVKSVLFNSLTRLFSKFLDSDLVKSIKLFDDLAYSPSDSAQLNKEDKKKILADWLSKSYQTFTKILLFNLYSEDTAIQILSLRLLLSLLQKEGAFLFRRSNKFSFPSELYKDIVVTVLTNKDTSSNLLQTFLDSFINQYSDLRFYTLKYIPVATTTISTPKVTKKKDTKEPPNASDTKEALENIAQKTFFILSKLSPFSDKNRSASSLWVSIPTGNISYPIHLFTLYKITFINLFTIFLYILETPKKLNVFNTLQNKNAFGEAWTSFMRLPLTTTLYKQTLSIIHSKVLPGMSNPLLLMDFLTISYDAGGPISLLALNGLFTLITKYNLSYPDFYIKLYALFDRNLLHVKYRSRFLRLVDLFLSSTHLPSYLVAAFIKRMARLCLFATPSAIAAVIPFIYNLLKRHPSCMVLIHRVNQDDDVAENNNIENPNSAEKTDMSSDKNSALSQKLTNDPYDPSELDPSKCNAISSSLWELMAIQNHYYANISTLSAIFNNPFTKPEFIIEDFLDHTYSTMFASETSRKLKNAPALSNPCPTSFLRPGEILSDIIDFS